MSKDLFGAGRGIALNGGTATPRQPTYQAQNKIDAGFASVVKAPAPTPPPRRN